MRFNEHSLETAIMELFEDEGYIHVSGEDLHRDRADVLIVDDLRSFLEAKYANEGITFNETERIIIMLKTARSSSLYESNKKLFRQIAEGFTVKRDETSQKDLFINLVDYEKPENNIIKIVNQVEIQGYERRIPDAIVYINGLPLVVMEFKTAVSENKTIHDAYIQLTTRYRRDIPELFKYNALIVISDGVNNKYGSFFAPYEYFYAWRKIESKDKAVDGISSLSTMVKGLFRKDRLLKVIKDYIYFPDNSDTDLKVVCRYPQFFAADMLFDNIKKKMRPKGNGKGGTYFGATGSGKSYTMLYLARLLMKSPWFNSPTILLITDRTDLDDQLSGQFVSSKKFIGDNTVVSIESREKLKEELQGRTSGGVYLTTIQKFTEDTQLLTDRTNVICISDEAHRSQSNLEQKVRITEAGVQRSWGFAKYLHDSLPNATYVGFTGTPIDATVDVFGEIVDSYTMSESVKDEITVNLVYEGRAAKVNLDQDKLKEIDAYYEKCAEEGANENQIQASQKAQANLEVIIGDEDRLRSVARDFVNHYERRVEENATVEGKAMFVCMSRSVAWNLYKIIMEIRPQWFEKVKIVMTRTADDEKDLYDLLGTNDDRKELDRQFKQPKSNFKIAIVVDMWLTGFDVPCLDTMYIDKPVQRHSLIQTISRVNRVYEGKDKGLIVDYIGIKNNMNLALKKYTNYEENEYEGTEQAVKIVKDQLEILDAMFHDFDNSKYFGGTPGEQLDCLNHAVEYIQQNEETENRFMAAVKRLQQAFGLCTSSEDISAAERDYIHFYGAIRSMLFKLTKGRAPDVFQMNDHVRKLVEEAIISEGVEILFNVGKHLEIDLFSEEYLEKIAKIPLPNTRIKLLQQLLQHAINEFKKVNKIKAVEFAEKLKKVVENYNDRRNEKKYASDVLDEVANQLTELLKNLKTEKDSFGTMGITYEEKAFYDILKNVAEQFKFPFPHEKLIELSREVKKIVDDKTRYTDCFKKEDIKAELQVDLILVLDQYGYPPETNDLVYKQVFEQAENFKKYCE
ncbi:restriction endonuclease subunit R [Spirochaetia bacterium]|nr:restriction endonuclease subunit R [Spirochaetia bacterium]